MPSDEVVVERSLLKTFLLAILTNLANPKIIIFYLAFLPQFLATGQGSWPITVQMLLLGMLFVTVGFPIDASAGLLAGTLSDRLLKAGGSFRRRLNRVSAAIYAGLAGRLVVAST